MKTRTIFTTLCTLFLLLVGVGCEDKEEKLQYEIYENHDVIACGVEDPLNNISWINDYCHDHSKAFLESVFIYKNKLENINYIVIETSTPNNPSQSPSSIHTISVYTCSGERILFYGTEGPKPNGWDIFFEENEKMSKLWSIKKI